MIANRRLVLILFGLIFIFGCCARIHPWAGFQESYDPVSHKSHIGFDEGFYIRYVTLLNEHGITVYPDLCDQYRTTLQHMKRFFLPPTRVLYIGLSALWSRCFGVEPLAALHGVSCLFSILTLVVSAVFAWRLAGVGTALGVAALMACAPLQIHMAQHALIDGVFAFWALTVIWLLWENLRAPMHGGWLAVYAAALACMVLTKENAAFAYIGVLGLLALNRWLRFGKITPALLVTTVVGPFIGVAILTMLAGGLVPLIETYHLSVVKASHLDYAIKTGDGPWYRYIVDLLLVTPVVLLLAVSELFRLTRERKAEWFLAAFVIFSYIVMANVKYGMNLRYAVMWEMPLCFLAVMQMQSLSANFKLHQRTVLIAMVVMTCAIELHQYVVLCVQYPMYELVSGRLLQALKILK